MLVLLSYWIEHRRATSAPSTNDLTTPPNRHDFSCQRITGCFMHMSLVIVLSETAVQTCAKGLASGASSALSRRYRMGWCFYSLQNVYIGLGWSNACTVKCALRREPPTLDDTDELLRRTHANGQDSDIDLSHLRHDTWSNNEQTHT